MKGMNMRVFVTWVGLVFLSFAGIIGGCSRDNSDSKTVILGWVSATEPISGADLAFYNVQGHQVDSTKKAVTGDFGSFRLTVKNLPADFRVVASSGSHLGEASTADLSADYRAYDTVEGTIYINAVTTMVSAYLDQHPDKRLDEATTIIKSFLGIPEWVDIGSGLAASSEFFSHGTFMEGALAHGGVNSYISQLIAELDGSDPAITHPFLHQGPPLLQSAGTSIAIALAEGAASYVGGEAMGWGLKQTGVWNPDAGTEAMQQSIIDISLQLKGLESKLDQIYKALSQEIQWAAYGIRKNQLNEIISNVESIRQIYTNFISNPPGNAYLEVNRQNLLGMIKNKIIGQEHIIPYQLREELGSKSLIRMLNEIVMNQTRFLKSETTTPYLNGQLDYFRKLQEWVLLLQVEYWHAMGEGTLDNGTVSHPNIDDAINNFNKAITEQNAVFKLPIPQNTMIDKNQKIMIGTYVQEEVCVVIWPDSKETCFTPEHTFPANMARNDFDSLIIKLNTSSYAGFNNWRKPNMEEVTTFYFPNGIIGNNGVGCTSPPQSLASQGWPEQRVDLLWGTPDRIKRPSNPFDAETSSVWMSLYEPQNCQFSEILIQEGQYEIVDVAADYPADWIPVRSMSDGEFQSYYW